MFIIPSFYKVEMSFEEACKIIESGNSLTLLDGMKRVDDMWEMFIKEERDFDAGLVDEKTYGDEDDFFDHWCYEVSAYNIIKENMSKLF